MVAVPGVIAFITPVPEPIVATPVLLLLHVPPPASLNVDVRPRHKFSEPVIGVGGGFTTISAVAVQPVPDV